MSALRRAMFRLLSIQGTWNYERMVGTGMAYAAEPLLEELKEKDPARYQAAMVRAGEFFNSHPYLAGLALGAAVRAEYEGVPGPQIQRLRTALCSPLGALGDQVFWTGVLPALVGVALALAAAGHAVIGVVAFAVIYNALRLYTGSWALRTGLASGMQVGRAIGDSWLSRLARLVGPWRDSRSVSRCRSWCAGCSGWGRRRTAGWRCRWRWSGWVCRSVSGPR